MHEEKKSEVQVEMKTGKDWSQEKKARLCSDCPGSHVFILMVEVLCQVRES